jgi:hypothetical protein
MISILTPSRSRPQLAHRMVTSAIKTAGCDLEIMLYLNNDDPLLEEYKRLFDPTQYTIGPNQSTSYSWNLMAEKAKHDILFLVGDDCEFITSNWSFLVLDAFNQYPDKLVCVYPRAPSVSKYKSPHFCLHKNWINTLGYFLPPHFYHWYVDTWILEIAQRIERHHLIRAFELPIEVVKDKVTTDYHSSWMKQKDDWMWGRTQRHRDADYTALVDAIKNFKK